MDLLSAEEFVSAILEMRDNKKAIDGGNPTTKYDGLNPADFGVGTNWGGSHLQFCTNSEHQCKY